MNSLVHQQDPKCHMKGPDRPGLFNQKIVCRKK